jgi:hypothetical protein
MAVRLDDISLVHWLWHDAEMLGLTIVWDEHAQIEVHLQTEINAEESLEPLKNMGIESASVKVIFHRVWETRTNVIGTSYPREVVLDWTTMNHSQEFDRIKAQGVAISPTAIHHTIQCSGGSTFDIICEGIWLDTL